MPTGAGKHYSGIHCSLRALTLVVGTPSSVVLKVCPPLPSDPFAQGRLETRVK